MTCVLTVYVNMCVLMRAYYHTPPHTTSHTHRYLETLTDREMWVELRKRQEYAPRRKVDKRRKLKLLLKKELQVLSIVQNIDTRNEL